MTQQKIAKPKMMTHDPHYQFELGDNIEIITYLGKGKSALFPGVVSEVKPKNDLYDLVRFDKSTIMEMSSKNIFKSIKVRDILLLHTVSEMM